MSPPLVSTSAWLVTRSIAACGIAFFSATLAAQRSAVPAALKIVVIAGEDAVNIVQQKTAVAPIVEVRDRNDQPVAGAVVNFAIRGGRASFGGARTIAVTTDVAGRAVAAGFTPTASGAVQISATAAFQGQTAAAVTIAQTNVLTAAQAAAVSSAGSSGGAASGTGAGAGGGSGGGASAGAGAGAGGGGGLSATTIGIVGGAVAGGAVVATKVVGGARDVYVGPFAFIWGSSGCLIERISGTITIEIEPSSDAQDAPIANGNLSIDDGSAADVSRTPGCTAQNQGNWGMPDARVTGTLASLAARGQDQVTSRVNTPLARNYDFTGSLQNGAIVGSFTMTWRETTSNFQASGNGPVTLQKQ